MAYYHVPHSVARLCQSRLVVAPVYMEVNVIRRPYILAAGLAAVAWFSAGCRAKPPVPASAAADDASGDPRGATPVQPSDTAFVELGRYDERGAPDGRGGCTWGLTGVPHPNDTVKGVAHYVQTVSVNRQSCVRLNAYGYRRSRRQEDTASAAGIGMESRTGTRMLTVDSLRAQPKRP